MRYAANFCRLVFALGILGLAGCRSTAPLDSADIASPGWETRQGQAVWRPGGDKPEIAGDVVVSTHPTGSALIQFSKTLPIVSGRVTPRSWEFEVPAEEKRYSGRGRPPKKLAWLQLLRALEGEQVPEEWRVIHPTDQYIALEHDRSGERVEVQFFKP